MKNTVISFLLLSILSIVLIFSGCKCDSDKDVIIYYDYSKYDNNASEKFKDLISHVNRLAAHLKLKHEFSLSGFKDLTSSNYKQYFNTSIDVNSKTFHVYVESEGLNEIKNPSYNHVRNYFFIPYDERNNPMVWLHEFNHKIIPDTELRHIKKINGGNKNCDTNIEGSFCLNLMSEVFYTPFGFLLTKEQVDLINGEEKKCLTKHVYPANLISRDIEQRLNCCMDPLELTRDSIIALAGKEFDEAEIDKILEIGKILNYNNICLRPFVASDTLEIIEITELALEQNPDTIQVKNVLSNIFRLVKLSYTNSLEMQKLFAEEADYLSENLNYNMDQIFNVRFKSALKNFQNHHIRANKILTENILQQNPNLKYDPNFSKSVIGTLGQHDFLIQEIDPDGHLIFNNKTLTPPKINNK